jgi:hypothetical protein
MFGRQRRAQQHAIEQLRAELAAERHARGAQLAAFRAALVDTVERASDAQHCAVQRLRIGIEHNTTEVAALLAQLAQTYGVLIESLDVARADRAALSNTLQQLVATTQQASHFTPSVQLPDERALDLTAEKHDASGTIGTEVWCRYQDRWIGGFEIADTVDDGRELRYRIRRTTDGYVLPTPFSPADVRAAKRVL